MEDSCNNYKFRGKAGEDFFLWAARTEAALASKELLYLIERDVLSGNNEPDEGTVKHISTARAVLIQGMGDRSMRLCLTVRENPFAMWSRLKDRYTVFNTATRLQLQT